MAIPNGSPSAPRWRTLAALSAAVLLVHLWGLGLDPLRLGTGAAEAPTPTEPGAAPVPAVAAATPDAGAPAVPPVARMDVTQVRWVVVEPAPAPRPARVSRPSPLSPASPASPPAPAAQRADDGTPAPVAAPAPEPPSALASAIDAAPPVAEEMHAQAGLTAEVPTLPPAEASAPAPPAASALPPSQPPASTRLAYDIEGVIKGLNYRASATLDWTQNAGRYTARTEMSMFLVGSRVQTSVGAVGADGLRPERFSDKRRSEQATHFEREAGRIRFSGNAPETALLPGAQDRLSLFMQLAGLLQARPHQAGDVIEFQVAGTGDAEPWRFEVGALQDLDLPAGTVAARWVRRLPRKAHDSTVEVWLAPSMNHLPVRLRITQANGDVADQRLARLP